MKLVLNNWLYNAGLVGLLRILQVKGVDVGGRLSDGSFEPQAEDLEGFADAYFKHTLQVSHEQFISYLNIKEREILKAFGIDYTNMRMDLLEKIDDELYYQSDFSECEKVIKDTVNDFSKRLKNIINKKFEEEIGKIDKRVFENKLEKNAFEKNRRELVKTHERSEKIINNVLKSALESFEKQKYIVHNLKRFYFNKDVIGNYSLTKGEARHTAFERKYIKPAQLSLAESTSEDKIDCKFCGRKSVALKIRSKDMVFNEGMFSISGVSVEFKNFFYNLSPDLFVCEACELILLCAWAGFNRIPFRLQSGDRDMELIFVNLPSLPFLFEQNNKLRATYERAQLPLKDTIYEDVMTDLFEEQRRKGRWVLQNVFFVEIRTAARKPGSTFKYFHVGKDVAELFNTPPASRSLRRITGRLTAPGIRRGLQLKREVVKRLLSGDQVYDLAYQICRQSLDSKMVRPESVIEIVFLHSLRRQIWRKYTAKQAVLADGKTSGGKGMEARQVYGILRGFYSVGTELGRSMELEKRQRLAYRLMSIVRSGKFAEFYDMLMKLYVDSKHPIPTGLLSLLNPNDAIEFESKAYALLSGFLGESKSTDVADTVGPEPIEGDLEISSNEGEDNG